MTPRTALVVVSIGFAAFVTGCSDSTDVSKKTNDEYHQHVSGPPPPPGAMHPPGAAVGPFAHSGGVPGNAPKAPYTGADSGPGKAPAGAAANPGKAQGDR